MNNPSDQITTELQGIRELCEKATKGPWKSYGWDECQVAIMPDHDDKSNPLIATVSIGEGRPNGDANAAFIATSRDTVERLVKFSECCLEALQVSVMQQKSAGWLTATEATLSEILTYDKP